MTRPSGRVMVPNMVLNTYKVGSSVSLCSGYKTDVIRHKVSLFHNYPLIQYILGMWRVTCLTRHSSYPTHVLSCIITLTYFRVLRPKCQVPIPKQKIDQPASMFYWLMLPEQKIDLYRLMLWLPWQQVSLRILRGTCRRRHKRTSASSLLLTCCLVILFVVPPPWTRARTR